MAHRDKHIDADKQRHYSPIHRKSRASLLASLLTATVGTAQAQLVIPVVALDSAPVLDGNDGDWQGVAAVEVPLRKSGAMNQTAIESVSIRGGVFEGKVYFFLQWQDPTEDSEHKPFVWDSTQNRYTQSKQMEDRLAIQFAMSGDYTTNWLSGNSFTADMWHWKAFRSNAIGLVHDKQTIVSNRKLLRSFSATSMQGTPLFILRPSDEGDRLYRSTRYREHIDDKMPKYLLTAEPSGSVADIKAKGVWQGGTWRLEIARKLNTQHADDVVFELGQSVLGGIAVFNGTGDDDHVISDTLSFQF